MAAGNCSMRACAVRSTSRRSQVDGRRGPVRTLERSGQRLEQPREHERQRLQPVNRPLELDAFEKARHVGIGHERARIDATRQPLQRDARLPQPRGQRPGRQGRQTRRAS